MNWLLWKEYRQNRVVVWATLVVLVLPHLIALYAACTEAGQKRYEIVGASSQRLPAWPCFERDLAVSSFYGLVFAQVTLGLIGGNAIAGERADRSAEFQAYLPIPRTKIVAAKLALSAAIAAVIWLPNLLIIFILRAVANPSDFPAGTPAMVAMVLINTAITGSVFFAVAWFVSSFLRSPAISVCAGLVTPALIAGNFLFVAYVFDQRWIDNRFESLYRAVCVAIAPACFAAGTWIVLRRAEP